MLGYLKYAEIEDQNAELVKAQADLESANFQLQSAKDRLQNLEMQLTYTTLTAPIDGLIVYATSIDSSNGGRGGGDSLAAPPAGAGRTAGR